MSRARFWGSWLLCLGLVWASEVRADGVELRETRGLRPDLCAALRIQLADLTDVRCVPDEGSPRLPERIARAASRVRDGQVELSVLVEPDPDPALVRIYVVGGQEDQAVLAFEQVENRADPDVDRSLALKVRAAVGAVRIVRESQSAGAQAPLAAALVPPPKPPEAAPEVIPKAAPRASTELSGALEIGGGLAAGDHLRGLGQGSLVARLTRGALALEAGPTARWYTPLRRDQAAGSVDEREWVLGLTLRALYQLSRRFSLGGAVEPGWGILGARGTTPEGARGDARLGRFSLTLALDARLRLFSALYLRLSPGVELSPVRQRFAIDDTVTLEVARARVVIPISLWVGWP